jgi:hypothetical protein
VLNILVCGGRDYSDAIRLNAILDEYLDEVTLIVTGACRPSRQNPINADLLAERWARHNEVDYRGYPAKFNRMGKQAGPIRNRRMLQDVGYYHKIIAFPGGRGTADLIEQARSFDYGDDVIRVIPYL